MHTSVLYVDYNKQRTMFLELWKDSEQKIRHCFLSDSRYIYYLDQNSNFTKCSQYEYTEVTNSTNDEVCFQSHMCTCFLKNRAYSIYWGHGCVFLGYIFQKKGHFICLHPRNRCYFLIISNENIFFKIQGTILGAIVAPNKGLE